MVKVGINRTIRILILSDFLLQSAWGFIGPIFALFVTQEVEGGSLAIIGFITATYWLVKSLAQPFISHFLDRTKGEKDDFLFLTQGLVVANLVPLGYLFSTQVWQIFLLEAIRGLAMACVVPTWAAFFTRYINKGWEAFSWGIQSTVVGLAIGFAGAVGGTLACFLGFKIVFILVSLFGLLSSVSLFLVRREILEKEISQE